MLYLIIGLIGLGIYHKDSAFTQNILTCSQKFTDSSLPKSGKSVNIYSPSVFLLFWEICVFFVAVQWKWSPKLLPTIFKISFVFCRRKTFWSITIDWLGFFTFVKTVITNWNSQKKPKLETINSRGVLVLNDSVCLIESVEWMIQRVAELRTSYYHTTFLDQSNLSITINRCIDRIHTIEYYRISNAIFYSNLKRYFELPKMN